MYTYFDLMLRTFVLFKTDKQMHEECVVTTQLPDAMIHVAVFLLSTPRPIKGYARLRNVRLIGLEGQ